MISGLDQTGEECGFPFATRIGETVFMLVVLKLEQMMRTCLACDSPLGANRTNEHIIADWLLQELGMSEEKLTQVVADSVTGEMKDARPKHPMDAFREGRVCGQCNWGWMSQLESQVRLILPDLMNGKRSVTAVSTEESLVIARWMLKTAVVLSHASGFDEPLPQAHLQFLKNNPTLLPTQIGVFGATQRATRDFGYLQRNHWVNVEEPSAKVLKTLVGKEYKLSIELRNLFLMAAYLPSGSSHFMLAAGMHVPIWPTNTLLPCYRTDLTVVNPYDSLNVLALFNNSLGAVHPSGYKAH